jgi:hypothetical protein
MTMSRKRLALSLGVVTSLAVAAGALLLTTSSTADDRFGAAKKGTAQFRDLSAATAAGFAELKDKNGIACIDDPKAGGMGIHYVLGKRVADPAEDAGSPEVLVYEPDRNGKLNLVAVEYVVLESDWRGAGHKNPPSLLGTQFKLVYAGNRYGLPPFYELHAWIWKHNPKGINKDYNPKVSCRHA